MFWIPFNWIPLCFAHIAAFYCWLSFCISILMSFCCIFYVVYGFWCEFVVWKWACSSWCHLVVLAAFGLLCICRLCYWVCFWLRKLQCRLLLACTCVLYFYLPFWFLVFHNVWVVAACTECCCVPRFLIFHAFILFWLALRFVLLWTKHWLCFATATYLCLICKDLDFNMDMGIVIWIIGLLD